MNRFYGLSLEEMLLMMAREYEEKTAMAEALEEGVANFRSQMEGKFEHDGNGVEEVCNLFREEVVKLGEEFMRQITKLTTIIHEEKRLAKNAIIFAAISNITTQEQLDDMKRSYGHAFGATEARK
tara:strand:- start:53 stop:427 length:375 start_codon:yes stop_codon:yes gene_type:complete